MKRNHMVIAGVTVGALALFAAGATAMITKDEVGTEDKARTVVTSSSHDVSWNQNRATAQTTTQAQQAPACDDDNIVGKVAGGAAGGLAGSQIGSGSGKTAATIGGTIAGTLLGEEYLPTKNVTCRQ